MAHFAEIRSDNNKVLRVVVINNNDVVNNGGELSTQVETWVANNISADPIIKKNLGGTYPETYWKQTSYNNNFRDIYAGIGFIYDATEDKFKTLPPHADWVFDDVLKIWNPPIPVPTEGGPSRWDQENNEWINLQGL